jgi:hypothetical protein
MLHPIMGQFVGSDHSAVPGEADQNQIGLKGARSDMAVIAEKLCHRKFSPSGGLAEMPQ